MAGNGYGGYSGSSWGGGGLWGGGAAAQAPAIQTKNNMPAKLDSTYTYQTELGEGACGCVYLYKDLNSGEEIAIKVEAPKQSKMSGGTLTREGYFMKVLNQSTKVPIYDKDGNPNHIPNAIDPGQKRIPKYYSDTFAGPHQCLKIEFIKYSVEEYLAMKNQGLKVEDYQYRQNFIEILQQMLQAVQDVHSGLYVHQDIKLDNFRVTEKGFVKLIDFGISMSYINENNKEFEEHKSMGRYGFQGTPLYGSIRSLDGYTQSRRDDVEALGYVFMLMLDENRVTWRNQSEQREIMAQKKAFEQIPLDSEDISIFHRQMHKYIKYCYSLDYQVKPDYQKLKDMLSRVYEDYERKLDYVIQTVQSKVFESIKFSIINEILDPEITNFILNEKRKQKERHEKKIFEQKQQKEEWNRRNNNYPSFQQDKPSYSNYNQSQSQPQEKQGLMGYVTSMFGGNKGTRLEDTLENNVPMNDEERINYLDRSVKGTNPSKMVSQATGQQNGRSVIKIDPQQQLMQQYMAVSQNGFDPRQEGQGNLPGAGQLRQNGQQIVQGNQDDKRYTNNNYPTQSINHPIQQESNIFDDKRLQDQAEAASINQAISASAFTELISQVESSQKMLDSRAKQNQEGLEKYLFRGQDFDSIIQTIGILDDSELRRAVQNLKPEQRDWKALVWLIKSKGQQPQGSLTSHQVSKIKALSSRLAAFQYGLKQYELESNSLIDQINYCAQGGAQQHQIQVEVDLARLEYAFNKQIIKDVWEKYSVKLPKNQYEMHIAFDIDNFQQKYKMQLVKLNSSSYKYQIKQRVEGVGKYPGDKTKCHYQLYARVDLGQQREFFLCRLCEGSSLDIFGCAKLE